jgi:hypothetical protein
VTVAGYVNPTVVLEILTGKPARGAADVSVIVQLMEAPLTMLVGVHVKVLSDCPSATLPNIARINASLAERSTFLLDVM